MALKKILSSGMKITRNIIPDNVFVPSKLSILKVNTTHFQIKIHLHTNLEMISTMQQNLEQSMGLQNFT